MIFVRSFTRLEPVLRGGDPGRGLAATVQDPFWMLARQRQFGELAGQDAGLPVQVAFVQREARFDGWMPEGGAMLPYSPHTDVLEALVAGEAVGPTNSVLDRVQAGRALAAAVSTPVGAKLRAAFPVQVAPDAPRLLARAAALFADGLAVAAAIDSTIDNAIDRTDDGTDAQLAAALAISAAEAQTARADLVAFARWCAITFGTGPNSWIPERLERRFELAVNDRAVVIAPGHTREQVDWSDFDAVAVSDADTNTLAGTPTTRSRIPTTIQFPGQPRERFWEFEEATLALSRIDAATNDLARLALVEFSTIYGNDWFTFPIPVTYGSMQAVTQLVVRDTFGTHELIAPATDAHWSMYRPTGTSAATPTLVVPAVTVAALAGDVVEEVRFVRDEMANLVWAVEQIVTDGDGTRRDLPDEYVREVAPAESTAPNAELAYRLMTDVPDHWVPFLPVRLTSEITSGPTSGLPDGSRQIGLVEAVLPRPNSFGDLVASSPRSSVLQELQGLVLPEEEVPSAGVIVRRRWFLARSADGGRHVWAARSVTTGRGEGASGLRFDVAEPIGG